MNSTTTAVNLNQHAGMTVEPPPPQAPASDSALLKLERQLMTLLTDGLVQAGFNPRRKKYVLRIEQEHPLTLWLTSYDIDLRWWRITYSFDFPGVFDGNTQYGEFTMHRDEFTAETVADLAKFLREPTTWRWPLFDHWHCYPFYAWSRRGTETYTCHRLQREAWKNWKKGKASR